MNTATQYSQIVHSCVCPGIKAPFAVEDENFMAVCFDENAGKLDGFLEYDKAFGT